MKVHAQSCYVRPASDPTAEAAAWIHAGLAGRKPRLILVIGVEEGHVLELLEASGTGSTVIAVEPDAAAAAHVRARRHLTHPPGGRRVLLLSGPDYAGAAEAWRLFPARVDDCAMLVHPRLNAGPAVADAMRVAQGIVAGARSNAAARRKFAPRYLTNVLRNLPAMLQGGDAGALRDACRGLPAIVLAAGPSLDRAIPSLQRHPDRGLIIAVDTALRPLLAAGITPHIVVGADPSLGNARHFQWLPACPQTWLVAESALDRTATRVFDGRTLWFRLSNHQPWPWLAPHGFTVCQFDMWGSVLTAAFQVALFAGCDPIVIAGADLAFTGGQPYARGTTYEFDWAYGLSIGMSLEEWWHGQTSRSERKTTPDVHGRETSSTAAMLSFRDWLVESARKSGRRVVNATNDGILHGQGMVQSTLDRELDALPLVDVVFPPPAVATGRTPDEHVRRRVSEAVREVRGALEESRHVAIEAVWQEFSGDGYDRAGILAALAQFNLPLEPAPDRIGSPATQSAPALDARLARGVPEGLKRWRSLDAGVEVSAPREPQERRALLTQALRLQTEIAARLSDPQCPPDAVRTWLRDGGVALQQVPEPLRWAIVLFAATLGEAAGHTLPALEETGRAGGVADDLDRADLVKVTTAHQLVDWTRAAASVSDTPGPLVDAASRLARLEAQWRRRGIAPAAPESLTLALDAMPGTADASTGPGDHQVVRMPLARRDVAELLCGAVLDTGSTTVSLFGDEALGVALRVGTGTVGGHDRRPATAFLRTLMLRQAGAPRAVVAYRHGDEAVSLRFHAHESMRIDAHGRHRPHHQWPRGIIGELPLGETGAVAWGNGRSDPERITPAYVMYRRRAGDTPIVQELPVRPVIGSWVGKRLYWSCLPSGAGGWTGIASWAPGEDVRQLLPGVTTFDIREGDAGSLMLAPCHRRADDSIEPVVATHATSWREGQQTPVPLGPLGATSHRDTSSGWTAAAYPHADVVEIRTPDGRVFMVACPAPFRLAWAGRSLVISTIDLRLLQLPHAMEVLDATMPGTFDPRVWMQR